MAAIPVTVEYASGRAYRHLPHEGITVNTNLGVLVDKMSERLKRELSLSAVVIRNLWFLEEDGLEVHVDIGDPSSLQTSLRDVLGVSLENSVSKIRIRVETGLSERYL